MAAKKKSKCTKKSGRQTRRAKPPQIEPAWLQAVADIVASAVARKTVQGQDMRKRAEELAGSFAQYIPRARQFLYVLCGHSPYKRDCRCHAYALLRIDAHDSGQQLGLPPEAIAHVSARVFDKYMNGRN